MKRNNIVDINLDRNRDEIIFGDDSINITAENGMRIEIPYESAEVQTPEKSLSFKKRGDSYIIKKKKIKH